MNERERESSFLMIKERLVEVEVGKLSISYIHSWNSRKGVVPTKDQFDRMHT